MKIFVEKYRLEKGLSLSELARRSDMAKSHLSYIEDGTTSPTIDTLCKISKALEVPCCELFSCDD